MPQLLMTPLAECRWCKLLNEARENKFDPTKRPTWSVELVLKNSDPDHIAWIEAMESKFTELHGESAKKSNNWIPVKPDKEKPREISVATFKLPQFPSKGVKPASEGPIVFDSNNNPWNPSNMIGNGSKIVIAFDIYAWPNRGTGAGMTFQPRQVQVVEYVAYTKDAEASAFTPVPGGFVDDTNVFNEAPGLTTED